MTQTDFDRKFSKPLMTRAELAACGITRKMLEEITVVLEPGKDGKPPVVPFGKIGAVPLGNGRKHLYRRCDVFRIFFGDRS